jgi:PDZ domain-containing protein
LIDTQSETLPTAPPADGRTTARRPNRAHRWWAVPLAAIGFLAIAVVAVSGVLPASLVADKEVEVPTNPEVVADVATPFARVPATAQSVSDRVSLGQLEGVAERDTEHPGEIYFVTVSEPEQTVLSWFVGRDEPEIDFLTEVEKYGLATPEERRAIALQSMVTSEQIAQFVALDALGYDVEILLGDVVVGELVCLEGTATECTRSAPADEVLDPGDRLASINGRPIDTVQDLIAELEDKNPGDRVELRIERPEQAPRTVEVELIASPDEAERTIIGFIPFDTATVELPFEIDIDTGEIGGPSAGLAFTLTLIDELSTGDLMGGRSVAVTGTIDREGNVGAIGGLAQKVSAVRQVDVDAFLVPAAQGEADLARARDIAGDDVEIITVATLDDALAALERLGGDPLPPG